MEISQILLTQINEPDDPARTTIEHQALSELVDSIKDRGLLQPILLKCIGDRYEIEAGHRRFLAMRQLGWEHAPSIIIGNAIEGDMHIDRAHENLIRENLSIIDECKLVNLMVNENGRGVEQTARMIKRSDGWVDDRLSILEYQDEIQAALSTNSITLAAAKELSRCKDDEYRNKLLDYVIDTGATARIIKMWVSEASVEKFSDAIDRNRESGIIQSVDIGATYIDCGICQERTPTEQLRHVWLCQVCMQGIMQIRQDIIREATQGGEK